MKILKVIHGYPKRYNAGSEVYSQLLCHTLANKHSIEVFTREENVFEPDYTLRREYDSLDRRVALNVINVPSERHKNRYFHAGINSAFAQILKRYKPDVVHIGHLNHLSTGIVLECVQQKIPCVYTLHDFWLACPRGQFIMRNASPPLQLCSGQKDKKCAQSCYMGEGGGLDLEKDVLRSESWVAERMIHVKAICRHIAHFMSPSVVVAEKVSQTLNIATTKISLLDYGFNLKRLENRTRKPEGPFVFGYIGTHIPAKGIQDLVQAFAKLENSNTLLRIWGREREAYTTFLKGQVQQLPVSVQERIVFMGEYANERIVADVFNLVDAIVVPSIWYENSPLVIHEAQQVQVPVITTDLGGMAEYVLDNVNGLTFRYRDTTDLAQKMNTLSCNSKLYKKLAHAGYLYAANRNIPNIDEHVSKIEEIYHRVIREQK